MTDEPLDTNLGDQPEKLTRAGLFEDLVGKAKEMTGDMVGDEDLARRGRDQQAEAAEDDAAPVKSEPK